MTDLDLQNASNPLLNDFLSPYGCPPFSKILPEHFLPAFQEAINEGLRTVQHIAAQSASPDFFNTIVALERADSTLNRVSKVFFPLYYANSTEKLQEIAGAVAPLLSDYSADVLFDPLLFKRVKCLFDERKNLNLSPEENTLLENTYKNFVRKGAALDQSTKDQLREIDRELSVLAVKFSDNLLADTNNWFLHITDPADLSGLPEPHIELAATEARRRGIEGWCITLKFPSYMPFLQYSDLRHLRERVFRAYYQRGFGENEYNNAQIVLRTVKLRQQRAILLGYESHAHFVLEESMAQTPEKVMEFLHKLLTAYKPKALEELEAVRKFAELTADQKELEYWDWYYFSEKLRKQEYDFDQEELRPYFSLNKAIEGVFLLSQLLWGVKITETHLTDSYHPEVRTFEVMDSDGSFLALVLLDLFPREGKSSGAWMTMIRDQEMIHGADIRPIISIVCNFSRPTDQVPALLTQNEFSTFLHEWGHALHAIFSKVTYASLSGTNVYRDFVELPSQFLENWALEKDYLSRFARHYATDEPMPDTLLSKLILAKNFQAAFAGLRQLSFAFLDMGWHLEPHSENAGLKEIEEEAVRTTLLMPLPQSTCISTSFAHIFSGSYASGYYSYKWAEVLDADAFSLFADGNLFSQSIAEKFRQHILSSGGTEHPMDLFIRFMGREPSLDSLLQREGLG